MDTPSADGLPVILVSAKNETTASTLISEIIDNEPAEVHKDAENHASKDRVWRITNKYYTADVRLHPLIDGDELDIDETSVEAHVIYLASDECESVTAAEARLTHGPGDPALRLLLADCVAPPPPLVAWARRRRLEPVPLRAAPAAPEPAGPFAELFGTENARAALHAHVWPGLVRTDRSAPPPRVSDVGDDGSSDEWGEFESAGADDESVDRAELFAAALGALPAAASAARGAQERELRLARAEELVAAFCRALGADLDAC